MQILSRVGDATVRGVLCLESDDNLFENLLQILFNIFGYLVNLLLIQLWNVNFLSKICIKHIK